MRGRLVSASLLSCDSGALGREAASLEAAGADMIHLDVMDGIFVPELTFGAALAGAVARSVTIPLDAHLMVARPEEKVAGFARAGCRYITVHCEAAAHLDRLLSSIRDAGCLPGVALNPATPPESVEWVLEVVELVLVMTVNPGYGGQAHIARMAPKVTALRSMLDRAGRSGVPVAVDGGVSDLNAAGLREAGADILVAGSYIVNSPDRRLAMEALR